MDKVNYRTTAAELKAVPLPELTKTYKPISNEQLIDLTLQSIQGAGFELDKQWYLQAREGQIATGHYTIRNIADSEMQLQVAFQNSYNKQVSLKFAIGTQILVCSNGCVSGDYGAFKRKHTGDVQDFTPKAITEYIKTAGETFTQIQAQREKMKTIELSKRVQAELVGRLFLEKGIIESTQMNIVKREIEHPTHQYGAPNSMWEIYQFCSYAMKEIHPSMWMKAHIDLHEFFTTEAGIIVNKPAIVSFSGVADNQISIFDEIAEHEREQELVLVPISDERADDVIY